MMQSLLPAHLSDAEGRLRARLLADRPDHPDFPGDGVAAAAGGRHVHRPPAAALFAARRHGVRPWSACCSSPMPKLSAAARRRGAGRPRLGGLPSRNRRASRGSPRAAATASRSRCSRSAAMSARRSGRCSPPSSSCRAGKASVAWFSLVALVGMVVLWQVGSWYSNAPQRQRREAGAGRSLTASPSSHRCIALAMLARPDLLQERLSGEPHQLLHLLPHRKVRRVGAGSQLLLFFPRRVRRPAPSSAARSATASAPRRHLVLDPRRAAVHAGAAVRQPVLDRVLVVIIGLIMARPFGDRRLRAGAGAGSGRHDRRHLLRVRLRHRRHRRRGARHLADQHGIDFVYRSVPICRCSAC